MMLDPAWFDISPLSWQAIGVTLLAGSIVGLERQLRGKPAGIRTSILITLGTYLFVALSLPLGHAVLDANRVVGNVVTDPSRIIGQVVTGIGFLGAGVMLTREGIVVGVTSAATIWVLAAIGVATGLGHYQVAIWLSIVVVGVLTGVDTLENASAALRRGVHRTTKDWISRKTTNDAGESQHTDPDQGKQ
ncbi:MAG: MgtC/SapB family protein [Gammaproteobacteria bacterium]|nr:MgtC/SapB family protein [Gammaproteobacteria bacterium]